MSGTAIENTEGNVGDGFVQSVREKIDDAIDVLENRADEKIANAPSVLQPVMKMSASGAFSTIRGILGIPDDIGGDED